MRAPTTPEPRRGRFRWRDFVVALTASIAFHVFVVVPKILGPLTEKPERPVEVAYIDPDAKSDAVTQPAPAPAPEPEPEPEKKKVEQPKPEQPQPAPPEPATVEPPKPEPPKPEPPKPETPPPPPVLVDKRKQMVDQDKFPDEADNADAKYLAQKNHRAAEETRAKDTNLLREVESENDKASADDPKNDNKDPDPGAKDHKIAELQDRKGPDKTLPRGVPEQGPEDDVKQKPDPRTQRGPLSMRDLIPKGPEKAKARDGTEIAEGEKGDLPRARAGSDRDPGRAPRMGVQANLRLDHKAYDRVEGFDVAEKERREAARAERSLPKGYYSRYLAKAKAMRSSIENFVSDVKPGNQQELGTRASPFAAYITAMHRQIHKLFTFGFLADIEGRRGGPYADESLWTQLQIVINPDGKVDKVTIVRGSGVLGFDVAAIDSIISAAPFPIPPKAIRSTNGKVYMDWQFHRDERACGTFGVDPYILTMPGQEQPHDTTETGAGQKEAQARAALLGGTGAGAKAGGAVPAGAMPGGAPSPVAKPAHTHAHGGEGASGGDDEKPASREPPRRLSRGGEDGDDERPSVRPSPSRELAAAVPTVTAEARSAAEGWFAAYARGDVGWMAGWSATPFVAGGHVVARDAAKLKSVFKQLLGEAPPGKATVEKFEVMTPAGLRGKLGGLPPGGEDEMLFATARVGGDELVLFLKKSSTGWRVAGLAR